MAVTAHFAWRNNYGQLFIENRLLAFQHMPGSHCGERIGSVLFDIVNKAAIVRQVCIFVLSDS